MPEILGRLRPPRIASAPLTPANGEIYYDTGTNKLYWWNGTTWIDSTGAAGSGTIIYSGSGVPSSGLGVLGNLYIDTATGDTYEKRSVGTVPAFRAAAGFAESSTQNTHNCTLPSGYQVGDLLIIFMTVFHSGVGDAPPAPTGWTLRAQHSPQASYNFAVYTRVADGSEGSFVTFSLVNSNANMASLAYSGSLGVDAFADFGSVQTTATPTVPSVTTTAANDIVIGLVGGGGPSGAAAAQASGWTERWDAIQSFANTYIYAMERAQAIAGASPTAQPTVSPSAGNFWTYALAVKSPTGTATWVRIGSYVTVADEGSALAQRPTLNFVGGGVTATDDSANTRTVVTIPSTPDATPSVKGIIQLAGDLAGTAASPQIATGVIVDTDVAAANKDGTAATPSLRTLGTGALQAAPGNDARFLPTDIVVPTGTRILTNKLFSGDTQPAFRLLGEGKIEWGPGGTTVPDLNLYRVSSSILGTDVAFQVARSTATPVLLGYAGGSPGGFGIAIGNPVDTRLYRSAAGWLQTDGTLVVTPKTGYNPGLKIIGAAGYEHALQIWKNLTDAQPTLLIDPNGAISWGAGPSFDTNLYRTATGQLYTDGLLRANGLIVANNTGGTSGKMVLGYSPTTNAGIEFGTDTYLYRAGVNALKTDGGLTVAGLIDGLAGLTDTTLPGRLRNVAPTPPGNDLNNAVNDGWYCIDAGTPPLNTPVNDYGALLVSNITYTGAGRQVFFRHGSYEAYMRWWGGSTWSAWVQIFDTNGNPSLPNRLASYGTWFPVSDCNSMTLSGWYSANGAANIPTGSSGQFLIEMVAWSSGYGVQFAYGLNDNTVWKRQLAGTWTAWVRVDAGAVTGGSSVNYGTTLPASPTDGQEAILVDSTTNPTYTWRFRYNASSTSAYKWECVGATMLSSEVTTKETTSSLTYVALTTAGPLITVPRAGDYEVTLGACLSREVSSATQGWMSYDIGATAAVDADGIQLATPGGDIANLMRTRRKTFAASDALVSKYKTVGGNGIGFRDRFLSIRPIRVS